MYELTMENLVLAQGEIAAPALPAEGAGGGATTGDPGTTPDGNTGAANPFGGNFIVIILVMVVAMFAFSMIGNRREKKKRQDLLSSIKKHDKVQTVGGVIGSIVEVKPDLVVLKVDESSNTRITFSRSAIQQVLSTGPGSSSERDS
ncbi:MAG: preprotein translocase subunit YajC [Phycisphaerales bacterium]|nr:MAG: preprotein translocase subunit YajC [Phycisphaerales bacterium]